MTEQAFPIVDTHQHVDPWPFAGRWGGIELNVRLNQLRRIDIAIISSGQAIVHDMVEGNARLAEALEGHPQLYGYVTVNPTVLELSRKELERYADNPKFIGAKIHTHYSGCPLGDPRLDLMLELLEEWGKPLLLHTWGKTAISHLDTLAQRHPSLPILVAHAGGDAWRDAIAVAQKRPNLYLDFVCSTPYAGSITRGLRILGAKRIVFGTDATLFDPLYMKSIYDHTPMTPEERRLIMGGNALRILGLDPSP